MPEHWRAIPGFPAYEASDQGRVRSHLKWRGLPTPRLLTPGENPQNHYLHVRVNNAAGETQTKTIHSLVLLAFVGPRPAGMEVRHLDGDRQHNALVNLRYGTASENQYDRLRHGTHFPASRDRCSNDHAYTPENTAIYERPDGSTYRQCRTCHRQRSRESKARAKARRLNAQQPRAA